MYYCFKHMLFQGSNIDLKSVSDHFVEGFIHPRQVYLQLYSHIIKWVPYPDNVNAPTVEKINHWRSNKMSKWRHRKTKTREHLCFHSMRPLEQQIPKTHGKQSTVLFVLIGSWPMLEWRIITVWWQRGVMAHHVSLIWLSFCLTSSAI